MRFTKFGLRSLLLAVSIVGMALGWFVSNLSASRNEERLVAKLNLEHGGVAMIDSSTGLICGTGLTGVAERNPTCFPNRLGAFFWPHIFERVTVLDLRDERYGDDALDIADQLPHLKRLSLYNTSISVSRLSEFRKSNPSIAVDVSNVLNDNTDTDDPFNSIDDGNPFGPAESGT